MPFYLIAWLVLLAIYILTLLFARKTWKNMPVMTPDQAEPFIRFSVIVPCRNEEENIGNLLQDLKQQQYPQEQYEVIIVDDHSEDNTTDIVSAFIVQAGGDFRLLHASEGKKEITSPKKRALDYGISLAKGDYIVTTDGDCRVQPSWLLTINYAIRDQKAVMVTGPVFYEPEVSLFSRLQSLELAALIGAGAVSLHQGFPGMANGANLAFSAEAFKKVGGYSGNAHIPSGDDEFLLRKIHTHFPDKTFFIKAREAVIYTKATGSWKQFFYQRRRWAGKWKLHKDFFSLVLPFFVFVFHLGWLLLLFSLITDFLFIWVILSTFILKTTAEFLFLQPVRKLGGKKVSLLPLLILQPLYSVYVIFFGIAANSGGYTWKGRKYSQHADDR